jgi:ParB family chromosome partitioning protein
VRQLEELVRLSAEKKQKAVTPIVDEEYPESYSRLVEYLEKFFSQDIAIKRAKSGGGKIVIDFASDADIDKFIKKFAKLK